VRAGATTVDRDRPVSGREPTQDLIGELSAHYSRGDPHEFGRALKAAQDQLGVSAERLAQELELSPQAVYRWLRGDALPRRHNLQALMSLLETPPALLAPAAGGDLVGVRAVEGRALRSLARSAGNVWTFSLASFTEARSREAADHVIEALQQSDELRYYYVFPQRSPAQTEFDALARRLTPDLRRLGLSRRVAKVRVAPRWVVTLAPLFQGTQTTLLELNRQAQSEADAFWAAFTEMPVVTRQSGPKSGEALWLEWPRDRASEAGLHDLHHLTTAMREGLDEVEVVWLARETGEAREAALPSAGLR
jgi:transcriptional regulator with XRE-family HTH domain